MDARTRSTIAEANFIVIMSDELSVSKTASFPLSVECECRSSGSLGGPRGSSTLRRKRRMQLKNGRRRRACYGSNVRPRRRGSYPCEFFEVLVEQEVRELLLTASAANFCTHSKSKMRFHLCSPHVEFCGYSIPHPSEAVVNLRIQTTGQQHFLLLLVLHLRMQLRAS